MEELFVIEAVHENGGLQSHWEVVPARDEPHAIRRWRKMRGPALTLVAVHTETQWRLILNHCLLVLDAGVEEARDRAATEMRNCRGRTRR
jgi:hypothetical protein